METTIQKARSLFKQEETLLLLFIVLITAISPIFSPEFFTSYNASNLLRQISYPAIVSIGMLLTVLIGGIDLSVGSIMQAVSLASIMLVQQNMSTGMIVIIVLALGMFFGLMNGLLITYGKLQPFIVTLGTKVIIDGTTLYMTKGKGISGDASDSFLEIGGGYLGEIPYPVIIMLVLYIIGFIILNKTVFGRQVYSVGSNRIAAHNSGIHVNRVQLIVYVLSGLFAAIAGLLIASRTGAYQPMSGNSGATGMELSAIAAVVVGGASLSGGKGSIWGAFLGALLSGLLFNLLVFLDMNPYIQQFILGLIILGAVIFSASKNNK
ncbi:ABC transporter permease [Paenibacillus zeisoli]|nr:ABC transporter permease [Paenibacillus zeisoli]